MTIEEYLKYKKLTQQEFADMLGVTQGYIAHYINSHKRVTAERALQIHELTKGKINKSDLRPDIFPRRKETQK